MRSQFVVGILLIVAFAGPAAKADMVDQTTYTINFTGTTPLPTGSFTYDPDTKLFSNFLVTWNGTQFDLTSSANNLVYPPVYLFCLANFAPSRWHSTSRRVPVTRRPTVIEYIGPASRSRRPSKGSRFPDGRRSVST